MDKELERRVKRAYQHLHKVFEEDDWEETLLKFRVESYKDACRDFDEFMAPIRFAHEYIEGIVQDYGL